MKVEKKKQINEATLKDKTDEVINKAAEASSKTGGIIEKTLDKALARNLDVHKYGGSDYLNIMFIGEAGIGKSARINQWAKENGVNLVNIPASTLDETDLGGVLAPSKDNDSMAKKLATSELDQLEEPKSVLFLDEFNRARASVRAPLLKLIQEHVIYDPRVRGNYRKLNNFLFTVGAINPSDMGYNTDDLDRAERSRFALVNVPIEKSVLSSYLQAYFTGLSEKAETELEKAQYLGRADLAKTLLAASDKLFHFDTAQEMQEAGDSSAILNPRSFTQLLMYCDGTKEDLLDDWDMWVNPDKKKMASDILANYKNVYDKASNLLKDHETESDVFKENPFSDNVVKELSKIGI